MKFNKLISLIALVSLTAFRHKDEIFSILQTDSSSKENRRTELVLIFTNDNDEVKVTSDSLTIEYESQRLGIEPYIYRINSSKELLDFLNNHPYKYDGLSIIGHGSPLLIDVDEGNSSFTFTQGSLAEDSLNMDITLGFLDRNLEIVQNFSLNNLSKNAQVTIFSCFTGRNFVTIKGQNTAVIPIGQHIANTFKRNVLCPKYAISTSGSITHGDTTHPTYPRGFLCISDGVIGFDYDNIHTLSYSEGDTALIPKRYAYNPGIYFLGIQKSEGDSFVPKEKIGIVTIDTSISTKNDVILFRPEVNQNT